MWKLFSTALIMGQSAKILAEALSVYSTWDYNFAFIVFVFKAVFLAPTTNRKMQFFGVGLVH